MRTPTKTERFRPPRRGTVFSSKAYKILAVYTGHRRVYRHDRGVVTVYYLQAILESPHSAGRAQSYELTKDGLLKNWEPVRAYLTSEGP